MHTVTFELSYLWLRGRKFETTPIQSVNKGSIFINLIYIIIGRVYGRKHYPGKSFVIIIILTSARLFTRAFGVSVHELPANGRYRAINTVHLVIRNTVHPDPKLVKRSTCPSNCDSNSARSTSDMSPNECTCVWNLPSARGRPTSETQKNSISRMTYHPMALKKAYIILLFHCQWISQNIF